MRVRLSLLTLMLVAMPMANAQDPVGDVIGEVHHAAHLAENIAAFVETHKDCDPSDLGTLQSDGYNSTGARKPCDAPDSVEDFDADRQVAVNGATRGMLFFAHEGVDDADVFRLSTQVDDRNFRYKLHFDLGLDSAPDLEFGELDFDVVTLDGHSLLDYQSPAYERPAGFGDPSFPTPAAGNHYLEVDVAAGYTEDASQYKVVMTPEAGGVVAPKAWLQLEDDSWVELALQGDNGVAKKYTAAAPEGACGVVKIVVEAPLSGLKKDPHVANAPPQGSCEGSVHDVPAPSKAPREGEFTVPAWLAGQDLAVIISVAEYTHEAGQRQVDAATATVLGLFAPRTASCDDEGFCASIFGEGGFANFPTDYNLDLLRDPIQF